MITIEKDVPLPAKYPFAAMEVGDSFTTNNHTAVAAASSYGRRNGMKFASRKNGSGYRIWRVA